MSTSSTEFKTGVWDQNSARSQFRLLGFSALVSLLPKVGCSTSDPDGQLAGHREATLQESAVTDSPVPELSRTGQSSSSCESTMCIASPLFYV